MEAEDSHSTKIRTGPASKEGIESHIWVQAVELCLEEGWFCDACGLRRSGSIPSSDTDILCDFG